jgi:biopolymer transport protein ExbB
MWPLLAASVIGLALILDRLLVFCWYHQAPRRFLDRLEPLVRGGDWHGAERLCQGRSTLARLAQTYLKERPQPAEVRQEILQREGKLLLGRLQNRVRWLAILGQLSPMLGLLGTVTGLVSAFATVQKLGGQVQPADLAQGIWEALLTTVFGLVIAIPCMAAYHAFQGWADQTAKQLGILVSYLDEWCRETAPEHASGNSASAGRHKVAAGAPS